MVIFKILFLCAFGQHPRGRVVARFLLLSGYKENNVDTIYGMLISQKPVFGFGLVLFIHLGPHGILNLPC